MAAGARRRNGRQEAGQRGNVILPARAPGSFKRLEGNDVDMTHSRFDCVFPKHAVEQQVRCLFVSLARRGLVPRDRDRQSSSLAIWLREELHGGRIEVHAADGDLRNVGASRAKPDDRPPREWWCRPTECEDSWESILDSIGAQDELALAGLDRPKLKRESRIEPVQLNGKLVANGLVPGLDCEQRAVVRLEPLPKARLR